MSISATIKRLVEAGASAEIIAIAVEAIEAARGDEPKSSTARQERNRRYYERAKEDKERLKASEKRLKTSENDASENRLKPSESVLIQTPLARVRDNITNSEIYTNHTTLNCESASELVDDDPLGWPEVNPPSRAYLDRLEAALREAGGQALSPISTNLMILAPILALGNPGKGPPCDLQADVLPVIRARSARAKPNSISTWGYFTEAIRQARDNRLAGAPASQGITQHERPNSQAAKFERRQAAHAADFAGSELASDLRAERRARYL